MDELEQDCAVGRDELTRLKKHYPIVVSSHRVAPSIVVQVWPWTD